MEKTNGNDSINAVITPDGEQLQFGLTKREYFAALAMQGLLAADHTMQLGHGRSAAQRGQDVTDWIAETAVEFSSALIRALNKEQEKANDSIGNTI